MFSIGTAQEQLEGSLGPGAAPIGMTRPFGPLPPGIYEVRQQLTGDAGTQVAYYQGNIDVYSTSGGG